MVYRYELKFVCWESQISAAKTRLRDVCSEPMRTYVQATKMARDLLDDTVADMWVHDKVTNRNAIIVKNGEFFDFVPRMVNSLPNGMINFNR